MKALLTFVPIFTMTVVPGALAGGWKIYHNPRFGTTADVPSNWLMLPPPTNGDGGGFVSPDGKSRISIYGSFSDGEVEADEGAITYEKLGKNYLVYSGIKDSTIFYHKAVSTCGGHIWNVVRIEYPLVEKARYDGLVIHISNSLRGGSGLETDGCR